MGACGRPSSWTTDGRWIRLPAPGSPCSRLPRSCPLFRRNREAGGRGIRRQVADDPRAHAVAHAGATEVHQERAEVDRFTEEEAHAMSPSVEIGAPVEDCAPTDKGHVADHAVSGTTGTILPRRPECGTAPGCAVGSSNCCVASDQCRALSFCGGWCDRITAHASNASSHVRFATTTFHGSTRSRRLNASGRWCPRRVVHDLNVVASRPPGRLRSDQSGGRSGNRS